MSVYDSIAMSQLLSMVNVKGLIEECLLVIDDEGVARVQAVDLAGALFLSCSRTVGGDAGAFGLTKISMLQRFVQNAGDKPLKYAVKGSQLTVRQKGLGTLRLRLLEPDVVPTVIEKHVEMEELCAAPTMQLTITKEAVERFTYFMGLTSPASVVLSVKEGGTAVTLSSPEQGDQFFSFPIGRGVSIKKECPLRVEVFSDHFLKVLSLVEPMAHAIAEKPVLLLGDGVPVVAVVGSNFWVLSPVVV